MLHIKGVKSIFFIIMILAISSCKVKEQDAMWAIRLDKPDKVAKFISQGNGVNSVSYDLNLGNKKTMLHIAGTHCSMKVAKLLFSKDVDPNIPDKKGYYAIENAVWSGCYPLVKMMLDHGAKFKFQTKLDGKSLLHLAAKTLNEKKGYDKYDLKQKKKYVDIIRLLLQRGVDPALKDKYDKKLAHEYLTYAGPQYKYMYQAKQMLEHAYFRSKGVLDKNEFFYNYKNRYRVYFGGLPIADLERGSDEIYQYSNGGNTYQVRIVNVAGIVKRNLSKTQKEYLLDQVGFSKLIEPFDMYKILSKKLFIKRFGKKNFSSLKVQLQAAVKKTQQGIRQVSYLIYAHMPQLFINHKIYIISAWGLASNPEVVGAKRFLQSFELLETQ